MYVKIGTGTCPMPTPPPRPVQEPKDDKEKTAREEAVDNIRKLCDYLSDYAYDTRSHMPDGLDYTNFTDALRQVKKFCKARPDWTLTILKEIEMFPIIEVMKS